MIERSSVATAKQVLATAHETQASLSQPFVNCLPITGAAVSILLNGVGESTVSASDSVAARLDELQFDLGEGPCWQAFCGRQPVLVPSLRDNASASDWPVFLNALHNDSVSARVRSMFAFPLAVGTIGIGAVDLYADREQSLTREEVIGVEQLAGVASWQVLRRIFAEHEPTANQPPEEPASRREIHQATGMVLVQLGIDSADAAIFLRAHAFAEGRSLLEIAHDVVERRLTFSPESTHETTAE